MKIGDEYYVSNIGHNDKTLMSLAFSRAEKAHGIVLGKPKRAPVKMTDKGKEHTWVAKVIKVIENV